MKNLFIYFILSFLVTNSFGQITSNNTTTNWNTSSGWSCNCIPSLTQWDGSHDVNISHTKVSSGITITSNNILTIKNGGHLTINGNVSMGSFGYLVVEVGGTLIINGDVTYTSNASITSNGTFTVNGNMTISNSGIAYLKGTTNITGYLSQAGPGSFETLGTLSIGTYFSINADGTNSLGGTVNVGSYWSIIGSGGATVTGTVKVPNGTMNVLNNAVVKGTGIISYLSANVNPANSSAHVMCSNTTKYDNNPLTAWGNLPSNSFNLSICSQVLPITLVVFEAIRKKHYLEYHWITSTEKNNNYFEIQVSNDAVNWKTIDYIKGAGNSSYNISYKVYSEFLSVNYAKLKQVDYDGMYTFSDIIYLGNFEIKYDVIYNGNSGIIVECEDNTPVTIYDLNGKIIFNELVQNKQMILIDSGQLFIIKINNELKKIFIY